MHVDLMAVVRKIGAWSKAQLKQREALAFVTDDPGAHKLFRGELHKLGRASCQNLTGQIDDLRSGFGEWLVKERCEAAPDLSHSPAQPRTAQCIPVYPLRYEAASDLSYASNLFVDELSARG